MSDRTSGVSREAAYGNTKPSNVGSLARTREEVRASASRQSTAATARKLAAELRPESAAPAEAPQVEDRSAPRDLSALLPNATPPEAETPEEVQGLLQQEPDPAVEGSDPDAYVDDGSPVVDDTLEAFAQNIGVDPKQLQQLTGTIKVNGKAEQVSIAEAFAGYQHRKANTEERMQLRNRQNQLADEHRAGMAKVQARYQQADTAFKAAYHAVQMDLQRPEVQALRSQDPGSYIEWQQLVENRTELLKQAYQQLNATHEREMAAANAEALERSKSHLRAEIPDFDMPERHTKIFNVLAEAGVSSEEAGQIVDPRILLFASRYADMEAELAEYKKRAAADKRRAKQLVNKGPTTAPSARRAAKGNTNPRLDAAVKNIEGKRGRAAREATAQAFFEVLQARRRRDQ